MFDIGFGEMVLLAAIALIAIGPKQLPEVARSVGRVLRELKRAMGELTETVVSAKSAADTTIRKIQDDVTQAIVSTPEKESEKRPESKLESTLESTAIQQPKAPGDGTS